MFFFYWNSNPIWAGIKKDRKGHEGSSLLRISKATLYRSIWFMLPQIPLQKASKFSILFYETTCSLLFIFYYMQFYSSTNEYPSPYCKVKGMKKNKELHKVKNEKTIMPLFKIQTYEIFCIVSLSYFIKHKHFISEEYF